MSDPNTPAEPANIRILYVGPEITRVQCGDVFARTHLAELGVDEAALLSRGEAELTDDAATVQA